MMGQDEAQHCEGRSPDTTIILCPAGMPTHVCLDLTQEHRFFQQSSCVIIRELQLRSLPPPLASSAPGCFADSSPHQIGC